MIKWTLWILKRLFPHDTRSPPKQRRGSDLFPEHTRSLPTEVEQYGTGSVEAANELDDGTYLEKTVLQFSTAEDIDNRTPMAFVVMDAQEKYFLIGAKEAPYPIMEITKAISAESNVNNIKVTFQRRKSLIACIL